MIDGVADALVALYEVWLQEDATLAEINPLIVTPGTDGEAVGREVKALDSKVSLDGNALYRHPENQGLSDSENEDPLERRAKEEGVQYVKLDGDIGILGNGAGLVMSTLDVVAQAGGSPANFLDAGGGSNAETIKQAVDLILANDKVKAVLVQHLRRHHPLRRGRPRADRRLRGDQTGRAVRRAPRRHQRRRGTPPADGGRAAQRARRHDDERGRRDGRRAGRRAQRRGGRRLMSVLVDEGTRLCVAGITGREGSFHTLNNRNYGTNVVGGVTPGKGGQDVEGIPVFDSWARGRRRGRSRTRR